MKINKMLIGIILASVLIAAVSIFVNTRTEAQDQPQDQSAVSSKLDQILNNEKVII